jgi:ATP-binding cassette subfamily C (CFTR/MRP) protein 1
LHSRTTNSSLTKSADPASVNNKLPNDRYEESKPGVIAAVGTFAEVSQRFPELIRILEEEQKSKEDDEEEAIEPKPMENLEKQFASTLPDMSTAGNVRSIATVVSRVDSDNAIEEENDRSLSEKVPNNLVNDIHKSVVVAAPVTAQKIANTANTGKLMHAEMRAAGAVKKAIYLEYFNAASKKFGIPILVLILFLYMAGQSSRGLSDYWIIQFSADNTNPPADHDTNWWLLTWTPFIICAIVFSLTRAPIFNATTLQASRNLHDKSMERLLRAPTNLFFDVQPVGRLINRFSKDLELVDSMLPVYSSEFLLYTFQFAFTIILAIVVTPYFIAVIVPIVCYFLYIQTFFRPTSRELKRLEGTTRSPIFSNFGETLAGIQTIRAYDMQEDFLKQNRRLVDHWRGVGQLTYW